MKDGVIMGYRIGSFNLKNLGLKSLSRGSSRDLQLIANIIKGEGFDVVALQEILSEGKALYSEAYAKKSLLMYLGPDWDFEWANAETTLSDVRNEGYAFVWNKKRLRLSTAKMQDGTIRTFYPRICRVGKENLKRRPFYARFTPEGTPTRGPRVELRLLCIHAYYGSKKATDILIRQQEIRTLLTEVYPQISERIYRDDMPHYTVLLGDYNLELSRPVRDAQRVSKGPFLITDKGDIVSAPEWGNYMIITKQDQLTTLKRSEETDEVLEEGYYDRGYANNYDHFSFDVNNVFKGVGVVVKRIDAVRKYCGDDFQKYGQKVSDHIPILMDIDFRNGR